LIFLLYQNLLEIIIPKISHKKEKWKNSTNNHIRNQKSYLKNTKILLNNFTDQLFKQSNQHTVKTKIFVNLLENQSCFAPRGKCRKPYHISVLKLKSSVKIGSVC